MSASDRSPVPSEVRAPTGLRWACGGCAACCESGFELGPVEPEVVADLSDAGIEALWPPAKDGWVDARPGPDGQPLHFLRQRGNRCVFLRDDGRCAVHALLGGHRKPGFCREFPYHLVHDPRGMVAVVRAECGGFHRAFRGAAEVGPELAGIAALPRVVPRRSFAPDRVAVFGRPVALETWMTWEDALLAALDARPDLDPAAGLALVRDALRARVDASTEPANADRARIAAQACLLALEHVLARVADQPGPAVRVTFVREMAVRLGVARERTAFPWPEVDGALAAYVHLLLRSHLIARLWQPLGAPEAGLGAFALGVGVGLALAPERTPEGFDEPYRAWLRLSANPVIVAVLRKAAPALVDLFVHAR